MYAAPTILPPPAGRSTSNRRSLLNPLFDRAGRPKIIVLRHPFTPCLETAAHPRAWLIMAKCWQVATPRIFCPTPQGRLQCRGALIPSVKPQSDGVKQVAMGFPVTRTFSEVEGPTCLADASGWCWPPCRSDARPGRKAGKSSRGRQRLRFPMNQLAPGCVEISSGPSFAELKNRPAEREPIGPGERPSFREAV
jgi:hypothetical protein